MVSKEFEEKVGKLVNWPVDELGRDFWRKKESIEKSANLRIILDSLSRIAGYCSDIAEAVINMCI